MSLKNLAEGIILQSIEDLWSEDYRDDCITFFRGKDFMLCAEMAGMDLSEQVELLNLVKSSVSMEFKRKKACENKKDARKARAGKKHLEATMNYT